MCSNICLHNTTPTRTRSANHSASLIVAYRLAVQTTPNDPKGVHSRCSRVTSAKHALLYPVAAFLCSISCLLHIQKMLRLLSAARLGRLAAAVPPRRAAEWRSPPFRCFAVPGTLPATAQDASPPEIQSHSAHQHAVISTFDLFSIGTRKSHDFAVGIGAERSILQRHWAVQQPYPGSPPCCWHLHRRAGEGQNPREGRSSESQPLWQSGSYRTRTYDG